MLNNFFFGTIQDQFSKSQHPIQKEVSQSFQSHMEGWDLGADKSWKHRVYPPFICHHRNQSVSQSHGQMTLPLGREGELRPRTVLQLSTSAGSTGHCTALVKTSVRSQCYGSVRMFSPAPFRTGESNRALVRTGSLRKSNFECHRYISHTSKKWTPPVLSANKFLSFSDITLLISSLLPQKETAPVPRSELNISHRFLPLLHLRVQTTMYILTTQNSILLNH